MKTKIFALFVPLALVCLAFEALAHKRSFPAGSSIIPMDSSISR